MNRPEFCTDEMMEYLNLLQTKKEITIAESLEHLQREFPELRDEMSPDRFSIKAIRVVHYWMDLAWRQEQ